MILAGGASARFAGKPKGLSVVGGRRVIDRVASALLKVVDDLLLVANAPIAQSWLPGTAVIGDVRGGVGPLGGIHAALVHTGQPILAVAWDMPFVESRLLGELRRRGSGGHRAVVPESAAGRLEPACAFYDVSCLAEIARWLDDGRSGVTAFLEQCRGVSRMPVADVMRFGDPTRVFFSINTPAELERAEGMAAVS